MYYQRCIVLIVRQIKERQYTLEVLELTSKLLKKNPEYYTIWNMRRKILLHGLFSRSGGAISLSIQEDMKPNTGVASQATGEPPPRSPSEPSILNVIRADLDFIFPLMVGWPKCYWIWKYRLWLLEEGNKRLKITEARELWQRELGFVSKMLTKDQRNFHGWGYRRNVVAQLENEHLQGQSMVEAEFEYTTRMINLSLKNFSAWHSRSKLIPRLLDERKVDDNARRKFLDDGIASVLGVLCNGADSLVEFDLIIKAIYTDEYPYDQSVWFYHQFLMTTLTDPIGHSTITPNFNAEERLEYVNRQVANVKEFLDGGEDCKWAYNALVDATLAVCEMQSRVPRQDEVEDLKSWTAEVRKLDPLRHGRWDDLEQRVLSSAR